jgi:hypothetical protein
MKISALLSVTAVIAVLFGLSFTFAPAATLSLYGAGQPTAQHLVSAQFFGITLIGVGVIDWAARNAADSEARRAIVLGNFVHMVAGLVLSLIAVMQGTLNAFGWSTVVIYLLLGIGFARFQFGGDAGMARAPS